MKSNDSYPPAENNSSSDIKTNVHLEVTEDNEVSEEISSESDDVRGPEEWDGSEAEIVIDDETEEYEEENTGIKIKYKLKPNELRSFIKHSGNYEKSRKSQKKHTIIQSVIFSLMILLALITSNQYYWFLSILPLIAIILVWIIPYLSIDRIMKGIFKSEEFSVEIFTDKIEVTSGNNIREIPLDGSCESEELEDMILIFSQEGLNLIIPLRAVEPEFRADVHAMIIAGAKPRYND